MLRISQYCTPIEDQAKPGEKIEETPILAWSSFDTILAREEGPTSPLFSGTKERAGISHSSVDPHRVRGSSSECLVVGHRVSVEDIFPVSSSLFVSCIALALSLLSSANA